MLRPRQGRLGLLQLLAELRAEPAADGLGATSLGGAVEAVAAVARARGLIVVVSDFRGERDWERPLRALRARHGVLAVEVRDPRELELTPMGDLWLVDPETGRQLQVNTSRRSVRRRFAQGRAGRARRRRPPPCAARAPTTSCSPPAATGCATSPATCAAAGSPCAPTPLRRPEPEAVA